MNATSAVFVGSVVVGGVTISRQVYEKTFSFADRRTGRVLLGVAGIALLGSLIAMANEDVAKGFMLLIVVGTVLLNGEPFFKLLERTLS